MKNLENVERSVLALTAYVTGEDQEMVMSSIYWEPSAFGFFDKVESYSAKKMRFGQKEWLTRLSFRVQKIAKQLQLASSVAKSNIGLRSKFERVLILGEIRGQAKILSWYVEELTSNEFIAENCPNIKEFSSGVTACIHDVFRQIDGVGGVRYED